MTEPMTLERLRDWHRKVQREWSNANLEERMRFVIQFPHGAAATFLDAHLAQQVQKGWHKVDDELPPMDVPVWLQEGGDIYIGGRSDGGDGWLWWMAHSVPWYSHGEWSGFDGEDDDLHPTKWMPLPTPPTDGEG